MTEEQLHGEDIPRWLMVTADTSYCDIRLTLCLISLTSARRRTNDQMTSLWCCTDVHIRRRGTLHIDVGLTSSYLLGFSIQVQAWKLETGILIQCAIRTWVMISQLRALNRFQAAISAHSLLCSHSTIFCHACLPLRYRSLIFRPAPISALLLLHLCALNITIHRTLYLAVIIKYIWHWIASIVCVFSD